MGDAVRGYGYPRVAKAHRLDSSPALQAAQGVCVCGVAGWRDGGGFGNVLSPFHGLRYTGCAGGPPQLAGRAGPAGITRRGNRESKALKELVAEMERRST